MEAGTEEGDGPIVCSRSRGTGVEAKVGILVSRGGVWASASLRAGVFLFCAI